MSSDATMIADVMTSTSALIFLSQSQVVYIVAYILFTSIVHV